MIPRHTHLVLAALVSVFAPGLRAADAVTFSEHIAPIVFNKCAGCHRPGQSAPFALTSYAQVKKRAKQIGEVTSERVMPPWHADPGIVEYANDRSLSAEQIALLQKWIAADAPEGNPAKTPPLPKFPEGWQLGEPDLVATMTEPFTVPAEGPDLYRNFVIPLNLEQDTWVRAAEYRPGDPSVVHHILYFLDTSGKARRYDERDPAPGYNGMARGNGDFRYIGGWDVGSQPADLPYGLALLIPKGADLVVQIHYHPNGKPTLDRSSVGFHFSKKPTARPWTIVPVPPHFGMMQGIAIEPGEKEHIERTSFTMPVDCEAFAVNAHAHYLGKRMEMTATLPDGTKRWMLKTSNWDFSWQEDYTFKQPIKLPAGTRLDVLMSYDNSADNPSNPTHPPKRVIWGPTTTDEMGVITLHVMCDTAEQKTALHQGLKLYLVNQLIDRLVESNMDSFRLLRGRGSKPEELEVARLPLLVLDKDGDKKLSETERQPAIEFMLRSPFIKNVGSLGFD